MDSGSIQTRVTSGVIAISFYFLSQYGVREEAESGEIVSECKGLVQTHRELIQVSNLQRPSSKAN